MMTKHKTSELEHPYLDAAVALAEGHKVESILIERRRPYNTLSNADYGAPDDRMCLNCFVMGWKIPGPYLFNPSEDWRHGGPILERDRIIIVPPASGEAFSLRDEWNAHWSFDDGTEFGDKTGWCSGRTLLIAAMRAFVSSKLGEEVELP